MTLVCADSPEGYGAFLHLFVCCFLLLFLLFVCCCCFFVYMFDAVLSPHTKAKVMSGPYHTVSGQGY